MDSIRYMLTYTQPTGGDKDTPEECKEFIFDNVADALDYLKNNMAFNIGRTNQIELTPYNNPGRTVSP